jgi:hypothetical protein
MADLQAIPAVVGQTPRGRNGVASTIGRSDVFDVKMETAAVTDT